MPDKPSRILPYPAVPIRGLITNIGVQIDRGKKLTSLRGDTSGGFFAKLKDAENWNVVNCDLLESAFPNSTVTGEYDVIARFTGSQSKRSWSEDDQYLNLQIEDLVRFLRTIVNRLELRVQAGTEPPAATVESPRAVTSRRVFVVHGHDEAARESVARFVTQLGLEPVILHEQPSGGQTVIEKFETHSDVSFAIVLLTPDDVGCARGKQDQLRSRARQNVLFELGFFVARLGRQRVCALHKEDVELPSDYQGVVYVPLDDKGAWKLSVARDMKSVGIDVDLNRVL